MTDSLVARAEARDIRRRRSGYLIESIKTCRSSINDVDSIEEMHRKPAVADRYLKRDLWLRRKLRDEDSSLFFLRFDLRNETLCRCRLLPKLPSNASIIQTRLYFF